MRGRNDRGGNEGEVMSVALHPRNFSQRMEKGRTQQRSFSQYQFHTCQKTRMTPYTDADASAETVWAALALPSLHLVTTDRPG